MDNFNQTMNDIENEHNRNGTEINHDGEIVFVTTAWACGAKRTWSIYDWFLNLPVVRGGNMK